MLKWAWCKFNDLANNELYEICKARTEVFVVEQNCAYQDLDGLDYPSWHLCAWQADTPSPELLAYLRLVPPALKFDEPSIGRVLTTKAGRGTGIGKELMRRGLEYSQQQYPNLGNRIGAQAYLQKFYASFGYQVVSDIYLEDNIPHLEMLISAHPKASPSA